MRARYYDPEIGRFITEDSYWGKDSDPLSLNLYTYCHNNPIMFFDPSGHLITDGSDFYWIMKRPDSSYNYYKDAISFSNTRGTVGKSMDWGLVVLRGFNSAASYPAGMYGEGYVIGFFSGLIEGATENLGGPGFGDIA